MRHIVLIERIAMIREGRKNALLQEGFNVSEYGEAEDWLSRLGKDEPADVAVIGETHERDALQCVDAIRQAQVSAPIVCVLPHVRREAVIALASRRVADVIIQPDGSDLLVRRLKALFPDQALQPDRLIRLEIERAQSGRRPLALFCVETDAVRPAAALNSLKMECEKGLPGLTAAAVSENRLMLLFPGMDRIGVLSTAEEIRTIAQRRHELARFRIGGASYPGEAGEERSLMALACKRMVEQVERFAAARRSVLHAYRGSRADQNVLRMKALTDGSSVSLVWDNSILSKYFEIKRYNGSVLEFSKRIYTNRYLDHYTKAGVTYTYRISGLSRHTSRIVESSIDVRVRGG